MTLAREISRSPHPLTGGSGPTRARPLPDVPLSPPAPEYRLLAQGWDTLAETFDLVIPMAVEETLEAARLEAEAIDPDGQTPHTIQFGGRECQIQARRPKRGRWVIFTDDFQISFRSPKMEWAITVRYGAAGLWEHGLVDLRRQVLELLLAELRPRDPKDWQRVSEAHWCFDFHAPAFTPEMRPRILENIVCHSSTKKKAETKIGAEIWGRSTYIETLTVGKGAPLEIQVYDKGKEITEASGKTWMLKIWGHGGWRPPADQMIRDVWRLEVRMRKDFLKERRVRNLEDLEEHLDALLAEALFKRRLVIEDPGDSNRWRWPLHPLWSEAYRATAGICELLPLGRQITMAGEALARSLLKNAAGNIRAATVLQIGDMDQGSAHKLTQEMLEILRTDPDGDHKAAKAVERYKYVNEAR